MLNFVPYLIIVTVVSAIVTIIFTYLDSVLFTEDKTIWEYVKNVAYVSGIVVGVLYLQKFLLNDFTVSDIVKSVEDVIPE
jgi:hypothetical protein